MVGMLVLLFKRSPITIPFKSFFKLEKAFVTKILSIGVPSAGEHLSYNISQIVLTVMITMIGASALATRVYIFNFMSVLTVFSMAITKGMQIFIGQLVGARKQEDAYHYMFMGLKIALVITVIIGSLFTLFGRQIFSLFTDNPTIIRLGATILVFELVLQPARTANLIIISALRAAGDAEFPVLIGISVMWGILVPLAYFLSIHLQLGLPGIWIAMITDECIRASLMYVRWKKKRWIGKSIARDERELELETCS